MSPLASVVTRTPMKFATVGLATVASPALPSLPLSQAPIPSPAHADSLIEVVLPSGVSVRVAAHVDSRVLGVLEGR